MAKYLFLKHYRSLSAPDPITDVPMERWTPEEVDAHFRYMSDFAARLEASGELVDSQALAADGLWVRAGETGQAPVTDGPFAETKDLIAGWMIVDVDSQERAVALAAELSAAPGAGGEPCGEWLEVRPFLTAPPTVTE
ncbi:MAG TPA: YciI family protein [Iamia sp.]|nr:YciI family protein [Iamia sp.]